METPELTPYKSALVAFVLSLSEHECHPALFKRRMDIAKRIRELSPESGGFLRLVEGVRFLTYVPMPAK